MMYFSTLKSILLAGIFLLFTFPGMAQVSVHSSDFNISQGETFTTSGTIGTTDWTVTRSGADWGARIHNNILELTNTTSTEPNDNGWVFAHVNTNDFSAPFHPQLENNTDPVSWYFNMRQPRPNPSGFGIVNYGVAFIIGTTSAQAGTAGEGYAVVLGNIEVPDPIRFVKYSGGVQSLGFSAEGLIVAGEPLHNPTTSYMSIRVTFHPATSTWELWGRNDGTSFQDPMSGELVLLGSVVDSEHTDVALNYSGAYWQGSTAANNSAYFDNFSVWVEGTGAIPPTISNVVQTPAEDITPETTVSVSADVSAGDADIASVVLLWGTESSQLTNTIGMSLTTGNTYSTDAPIPAQPHNTTVYYRVQAQDEDDLSTQSPVYSYLVLDPDVELAIQSVSVVAPVTVDYGTAFEDISLPVVLTVSLENNQYFSLEVTWLPGDYDPLVADTYLVEGELVLVEGIINPFNIQPSVEVTVLEEVVVPENIVVGWTFPEAETPGANLGLEQNLGKLISREAGFTGNYTWPGGVTGQSISSTGWAAGQGVKYWQVEFSTLGYEELTISSAQQSSNTGPRDFKVQYRIAQGEWQDVPGSQILVANNFTSGVLNQLALPDEMDEKASVSLRWVMTSNTAVNGSDVAAAGTSRIDNIIVEGLPSGFVPNVVSVAPVATIQVEEGTPFIEIPLPETVAVTLSNNLVVNMNVAWLEGDYDPDVLGDYLILGDLVLPDGVTNDNGVQAQVTVTVVEEIIILNIISVHVIDQVIIVEEGKPFGEIELPVMVDVTLEDDSVIQLAVIWQPGDYNAEVPGFYEIEGELVLVQGIANPDNLKATITVEVVEVPQEIIVAGWSFPENTQQADQGIEANIGKLIIREPSFEGSYTFSAGASGSAISTNQWAEGEGVKYWMVELSTIGYGDLNLSSKQRSSGTGPRDFKVQYRIGTAGTWMDVESSDVTVADNFTSGVLTRIELPAAANNKPFLFIRWIMTSNTSVNDGNVAAAGTSRIDDIYIKGVFSSDFKRIVTGVQAPQPLQVEVGTAFDELDLPETVTVIFDDEGTESLAVNWLEGDYDGDQLGTYTIMGEITLLDGMENPDNIMAQIEVNVVPEIQIFSVTFNVDMSNAANFNPEADQVLISGSMFNFAIPGTLPDEQTMTPAGNMLYTITMQLEEGSYIYKYYINAGLGNPEPGTDRVVTVASDTIFNDLWGATMVGHTDLPVVSLFPNPAREQLQLTADSPIRMITITDLSGKEVARTEESSYHVKIPVAQLGEGIYMVRIQTLGGVVTRKLVIVR